MMSENKKNIMFVIARLTGGGAERVVSVWANMLNRKGYNVSILLAYRSENEYETDEGIDILTIGESESKYIEKSFKEKITIIRNYIKKSKIDYVISFLFSMQILTMIASIGLKIKRIETIRVNPWMLMSLESGLKQKLWKICFITSSAVIVQTQEQLEFFSKRNRKKSIVIPNPIADCYINKFKSENIKKVNKFIAVGRITSQKNYEMMISAFAKVKDYKKDIVLDIYGTGEKDYIEKIQNIIKKYNLESSVKLKGRNPYMENVYSKYDVFLMTSNYEGLPNALIEAMASRLVCISTNCKTGPKDLIDDTINGFLTKVGDEEDMVLTIKKVIDMSPRSLNDMADNARNKIINYCSKENGFDKLCNLIDNL